MPKCPIVSIHKESPEMVELMSFELPGWIDKVYKCPSCGFLAKFRWAKPKPKPKKKEK